MDIGFNRSRTQDPAKSLKGPEAARLDWHGLRARLVATRAMRQALASERCGDIAAAAGSFDSGSARAVADFEQLQSVINPTFWADGKPGWAKDAAVAGATMPGERG